MPKPPRQHMQALGMVPQPVQAVVLLFPIKDASEKTREEQAERIAAEGQEVADDLYCKAA